MSPILSDGYSIYFNENGPESLNFLLESKKYSKIFLLVDENTNEHCSGKFLGDLATEIPIEIIEIESGESAKDIEICVELWRFLTENGADRKAVIINLGGGVISDIGGFIASTYKRGIDYINVPTTLLAMVDASIGGKNGIDLDQLKNQIGTITTPQLLYINTEFLHTLPQEEMRSGLAEMIKHGLIADRSHWDAFSDLENLNFEALDRLIYDSVEIKNRIVMQDPKEDGIRKSLNFGHTIGHAIESYFLAQKDKKTLLHGEAIAIGMVLEAAISTQLNMLSQKDFEWIEKVIFSIFPQVVLAENDITNIIDLLKHDKKNEYGKILFSLIDEIGNCKYNISVEIELIYSSLKRLKS